MSEQLQNLYESPKNSPESSESVILKWVTLLDVHFNRKERLEPAEKKIYINALRKYKPSDIEEGMHRAMKECTWMPKIADIIRLMPESHPPSREVTEKFESASSHVQYYSETHNLRYLVDKQGFKQVKFEKITAGDYPARRTVAPMNALEWDEVREALGILAKKKAM